MIGRAHKSSHASAAQQPAPLLTAIKRNIIEHQLIPADSNNRPLALVIGVSGGADSICLLHALGRLSTDLDLDLHVAHINHGLRPESAEDAGFVAAICGRLELPYYETTLTAETLASSPGGLEAGARRARYAFLCRIASNVSGTDQVPIIAVAHNMEDQAETLLLNLVRGSGLRGLGGMHWRTKIIPAEQLAGDTEKDIRPAWLIRPLLNIHRSEIEAYLTQNDLTWRDDTSNRDTRFSRNFLRHRILPQLAEINPNIVNTLARSAQIVSADAERLAALDHMLFDKVNLSKAKSCENPVRIVLDYRRFTELTLSERRGVLRTAIDQLPGGLYGVDSASLDRLINDLHTDNASDTGSSSSGPSTSGPHTLIGSLAWSFVSAQNIIPARLIVHVAGVQPIAPEGPQLEKEWSSVRLPVPGELLVNGWRLIVQKISVTELPSDWRQAPPWQAWLDADQVGSLTLSRPVGGMRVEPLGMDGQTKSLGNLFTDEKIHPSLREGWPLLIDSDRGEILWVCGLKLGHRARITDNTQQLLALEWESI